MGEMLTWMAESGERITVVGILLIVLFVIVYGVQKRQRWWCPGWMLTDCEAENRELRDRLQVYIDRTQHKLDELEAMDRRERESRR